VSNGSALFSPLVMRDVALANRIAVRRTALRLLRIAAVSLAVAAPIASAQNDAYPSKPVRIVIGAAPGGGLDATARAIQDRLVAALGQPVIMRLNKHLAAILDTPEVKQALFMQGVEASHSTPEVLARYMQSEFDKWSVLIKKAKIDAR
jgi:tripartite-type tricarboxylate transporter receptor subunit TctC